MASTTDIPVAEAPKTTLLSSVAQAISSFDAAFSPLPGPSHLHPFAPNPPDTEVLVEAILNITNLMTNSLATHIPTQDPKYVSRAQEYTAHADSSLQPQIQAQRAFQRMTKRPRLYGSDIPLERSILVDWIVEELGRLIQPVVSDFFQDKEGDDKFTIICGGKIVVFDVELRKADTGVLHASSVKSTHASSESSGAQPSTATVDISTGSLDAMLLSSFRRLVDEFQKEEPDCVAAGELGESIQNHFRAIMDVDALANEPSGLGIKWFKAIAEIDAIASDVAGREAQVVAKNLGVQNAPLDVFLSRAHALPLTYLSSHSLAFLIHLSPQAYQDLVHRSNAAASTRDAVPIDIPLADLRSYLTSPPSNKHVVIATLAPGETRNLTTPSMLTPSFPLLDRAPPTLLEPDLSSLGVHFSVPNHQLDHTFPSNDSKGFVLDFGSLPMRRDAMNHLHMTGSLFLGMDLVGAYHGFRVLSWLDLVIDPATQNSSLQYVATYAPHKTSTPHPTLRYMISTPSEPGFVLGKIRVNRMNDVWAVLETVRQQCWINDVLKGFGWKRPGEETLDLSSNDDSLPIFSDGFEPTSIPVQITFIPSSLNPLIRFTLPLPQPGFPILSFAITHDISSLLGCRIEFDALPARLDSMTLDGWRTSMEEIVRRGGASILAGWIWRKAKALRS